ncbi:MAG: hypothetical protein J7539_05760 [Niabella sp.]|nr:hypothetical protein [Niabella sp.]
MSVSDDQLSTGSNCIEVEYFFEEKTHLMDALVQNKCEYELLALIREIATRLKLRIIIETTPLAEQGFRRRFKVALKKATPTASAAVTIITAALAAVITAPLSVSAREATQQLVQQLFDGLLEPDAADKEKLQLQTEQLKQRLITGCASLDDSKVIKKRRSNFFELLNRYPRINRVQFIASDENSTLIAYEKNVRRQEFETFIVTTNATEPETIDNADIEIISPVLKKSNNKWTGLYKGSACTFTMQSKEFNKLVQSGKVQFKNGTVINCQLTIHKKINNEGVERVTGMAITEVNRYFENDIPVETAAARKPKKPVEPEITQLALFM